MDNQETVDSSPASFISKKKGCGCLKWFIIFFVICIIALFFISKKTREMQKRAYVFAAINNFKHIENALHAYLSSPDSKCGLPITEGSNRPVIIRDVNGIIKNDSSEKYILEQILEGTGNFDWFPRWRIGTDWNGRSNTPSNLRFSKELHMFTLAEPSPGDIILKELSDWSPCNRSEVSLLNASAPKGNPSQLPVILRDGKIDQINFYLDGYYPLKGKHCAYVVLKDVDMADAQILSEQINGPFYDTSTTGYQYKGRLIFDKPSTPDNKTDVYYYLCHTE